MKTAFVLWTGALGGTEALWVDLVERANDDGHEATLLVVTGAGPLEERLSRRNVPYVELGFRTPRAAVSSPRRLGSALRSLGTDGAVLATTGLLPMLCRLSGYRGSLVAVEHGGLLNLSQSTAHTRVRRRLVRRLGRRQIDAEVGVSVHMLKRLRNGDEARLSVCIPNGVDLRRFRPVEARERRPETVFGWAGRMVAGKGLDVLLEAVAVAESSEITLLLAGDGPERPGLERLASDLAVSDRIKMLGRVQEPERFWRQCDVGVACSDGWEESFGLAAIEASASGLPVIASNHGALAEVIVDGVTGTLTARGDARDLARAMVRYHSDPGLRDAHGRSGHVHVRDHYSLESCLESYLGLLQRLNSRR